MKVVGQIKDKNRIEGQWVWDEVTAEPGNIPECAGKSYSFSASVEIPRGFKFTGNEHSSASGTTNDKPLSLDARSFVRISTEKEGLIYKYPLPKDGMILSGSQIITEKFNLCPSLGKEGRFDSKD